MTSQEAATATTIEMTEAELYTRATELNIIDAAMQIEANDIPWVRSCVGAILGIEIVLKSDDDLTSAESSLRVPYTWPGASVAHAGNRRPSSIRYLGQK